MIKPEDKVAQCRYCPNCSNQGQGVWFKVGRANRTEYWICRPCVAEIISMLTKEELKYWASTGKK